ncbi:MAG TPA: hypothetical protein VM493_01255 [Vicinamibacterales bacterium]|jgi:hypothetical protein|nr:hypothetical protein [Vicinamibacterales bacterium]
MNVAQRKAKVLRTAKRVHATRQLSKAKTAAIVNKIRADALTDENLLSQCGFRLRPDGLVILRTFENGGIIWATTPASTGNWFVGPEQSVLSCEPLPKCLVPQGIADVHHLVALMAHTDNYDPSKDYPCTSSNAPSSKGRSPRSASTRSRASKAQ